MVSIKQRRKCSNAHARKKKRARSKQPQPNAPSAETSSFLGLMKMMISISFRREQPSSLDCPHRSSGADEGGIKLTPTCAAYRRRGYVRLERFKWRGSTPQLRDMTTRPQSPLFCLLSSRISAECLESVQKSSHLSCSLSNVKVSVILSLRLADPLFV